MKTDHRQPPAWAIQFGGRVQRALQDVQFIVDYDPQRLKRPRRGMNVMILASRHTAATNFDQIVNRFAPALFAARATIARAMRRLNRSSPYL